MVSSWRVVLGLRRVCTGGYRGSKVRRDLGGEHRRIRRGDEVSSVERGQKSVFEACTTSVKIRYAMIMYPYL